MASFSASVRVLDPEVTGTTVAPSSFMRYTLIAWRFMSSSPMYTTHSMPKRAATVAVATPCWPAPVSAMLGVLAHDPGEQRLADGVVDLVRTGMVQVFALQINARAAELLGQAPGGIKR